MTQGPKLQVEYGNQTQTWLQSTVEGLVNIGGCQENGEFWVGETGEEVIIGLPFLKSVTVTNLDWKAETFAFTNSRDGRQQNVLASIDQGRTP
jgi:hypothetical protein